MKLSTRLHLIVRPAILPSILVSMLLASHPCEAVSPPPNDNLASAQAIPTDSFSVAGTEVDASQEAFELSTDFADTHGYYPAASVWYKWTPSVTGSVKITVHNTSNSASTAAFLFRAPGTPTKETYVAGTPLGLIEFSADVTANQPYFIFVANSPSNAHSFNLVGVLTAGPAPTPTPTPVATAPVVTMTVKTPKAVRSSGATGEMLIELSTAATANVTVAYKIGGTAVNGVDYKLLSGSVTVPAGATKAAIKIKPRAASAGTIAVKVTLASGEGYTVGGSAKAKVKIVD